MILLSFLFLVSLAFNFILIWYVSKIVKNLRFGVENVDEFQKLLDEYSAGLENVVQMQEYYADETIMVAIKNTKLVIEACKTYKKSILDSEEQENNLE